MDRALELIAADTLPIPIRALRGVAQGGRADAQQDRFPKGEIVKFFPKNSYGFIKDCIGRELFFHVDEVDLVGRKSRRDDIRVGAAVGYDCCRTSHGLRVKRMKIY